MRAFYRPIVAERFSFYNWPQGWDPNDFAALTRNSWAEGYRLGLPDMCIKTERRNVPRNKPFPIGDFVASMSGRLPLIAPVRHDEVRDALAGQGRFLPVRTTEGDGSFWVPPFREAVLKQEERTVEDCITSGDLWKYAYAIEDSMVEDCLVFCDPRYLYEHFFSQEFIDLYKEQGWTGLDFRAVHQIAA